MYKLYQQINPYLVWNYRSDFNGNMRVAYSKLSYTGKSKLINGNYLYGQFKHLGYLFSCRIIKTWYGYVVLFEVEIK